MARQNEKIKRLTELALFTAMIAVLAMVPMIGYIQLGPLPVRATTIHIPVIIGAILFGPKAGAFLGAVFGLTSLLANTFSPTATSFVFSPFYSMGEYHGNFWSLVICFVPRIMIGVCAALLYRVLISKSVSQIIVLPLCGFVGSMINTILVMGGICLFFGTSYAAARGVEINALYKVIGSLIGINGSCEAVLAALLTAVITKPLLVYKSKNRI